MPSSTPGWDQLHRVWPGQSCRDIDLWVSICFNMLDIEYWILLNIYLILFNNWLHLKHAFFGLRQIPAFSNSDIQFLDSSRCNYSAYCSLSSFLEIICYFLLQCLGCGCAIQILWRFATFQSGFLNSSSITSVPVSGHKVESQEPPGTSHSISILALYLLRLQHWPTTHQQLCVWRMWD